MPDTLADPAVEAVSETGSATVSVDESSVFVLPDAGGTGADAGGTGAGGAGAGSEITENPPLPFRLLIQWQCCELLRKDRQGRMEVKL